MSNSSSVSFLVRRIRLPTLFNFFRSPRFRETFCLLVPNLRLGFSPLSMILSMKTDTVPPSSLCQRRGDERTCADQTPESGILSVFRKIKVPRNADIRIAEGMGNCRLIDERYYLFFGWPFFKSRKAFWQVVEWLRITSEYSSLC